MCRTESCTLPLPSTLSTVMPSHQLTQPMKPKLPRKLATSARINLNKYWHALEELMPVSRRVFDESDCNAINENIDNEQRLAAMQISAGASNSATHGRLTPMSGVSPDTSHSGKKSSFTFTRISSFLKVADTSSKFPMALDVSSDENTPPSSTSCGSVSR